MNEEKIDNERSEHPLLCEGQQFVPYLKELRKLRLVKSVTACILLAQLEYWYSRSSKPHLWKYLKPPTRSRYAQTAYLEGHSWTEELGFSAAEFRTAFDQIGKRYNSRKDYAEAKKNGDPFEGKYYLSYFQKPTSHTFYLRNQKVLVRELCSLPLAINIYEGVKESLSYHPSTASLEYPSVREVSEDYNFDFAGSFNFEDGSDEWDELLESRI